MIRRNFLLVALVVCSLSTARADQPWVEVTSPHFSVFSDGGEKRAREVIQRFEQMRIAFGVMFAKLSVNTAPLQIIAFRNNKELRQYSPLYNGKPIELAGFFLGNGGQGGSGANNDRQYIALDLSGEDNWDTVFHEYAHLLINSNFPPTPVWFDEGFAEYCSSLKVDKHEIDMGLPKPGLMMLLGQSRWLKIEDLFSVRHDSQIYNRDDRRSVFYAQSWATVHFLMAKKMLKQLSDYVRLTQNEHVPVPEAIRRSFGMEPDALGKLIENYLRTGTMHFITKTPPGSDALTFNTRSLNDVEVKSVMADLDYHSRDYRSRGLTELQEVLNSQPDDAIANRDLGFDAMQKAEWSKAGEYFKRAAAHDAKDPRVHYFLARMMSSKTGASKDDATEAITKELNIAIALDPTYADAYNLLGITLSFAGKSDEGIAALVKAVTLSPRNPWYSANLANAYLRAKDFDHAIPFLKELQKSGEPGIASMAAQLLQQTESRQAILSGKNMRSSSTETSPQTVEVNLDNDADKAEQPAKTDAPAQTIVLKSEPVLFMKGILNSVDCSVVPAATLTISSAGKKWKLLAPESKKLVVIGADSLSCSWTNRKVAVNYRKTGDDQGNIVSLELE